MQKQLFILVLGALALSACSSNADLADRVVGLENRVATLEARTEEQSAVVPLEDLATATVAPTPEPTQPVEVDYLSYADLDAALALLPSSFEHLVPFETLQTVILTNTGGKDSITLVYVQQIPDGAIRDFAGRLGSGEVDYNEHGLSDSPSWKFTTQDGLMYEFVMILPNHWYDGYRELDQPGMSVTVTEPNSSSFDLSYWIDSPLFDLSTYGVPETLAGKEPQTKTIVLALNGDGGGSTKMMSSVEFGPLAEPERRECMKSYVFLLQGHDWYADEILEGSYGFVAGRFDEDRSAEAKMLYADDGADHGILRVSMFYLENREE